MMESFFISGDLPVSMEKGYYHFPLIILSYVVASFASYTALSMAHQLVNTSSRREQRLFHWGGAFAMGVGIWSMHFIGMLSYKMRMVVEYDPLLTLLSMLIAVAVAYGVLWIVARENLALWQATTGAVLLGLGISGMHYTGMAAMKMDAHLRYVPSIFLLSVAIAIAASGAALYIAFTLSRRKSEYRYLFQTLAALVMGAAICGMHYTGMAAAIFMPFADCRYNPDQNFDMLALAVGAGTAFVLAIALAVGIYRKEQVESQLHSNREKLQVMIDNALNAVITLDDSKRIIEWNKRAESIFGLSFAEVSGKGLDELLMMDSRHIILGKPVDVVAINHVGRYFPVELTLVEQKLQNTRHFIAFVRDVSEQRQAEATRGLLAAIVESSDDPVISRTLDDIITSWNAAAERLFGYSPQEAIGKPITLIVPDGRMEEEKAILRELHAGKRIKDFETVRMTKSGQHVHISLRLSPILDANGKIIGTSKIVRDITERKRTEVKMKTTLEEVTVAKRLAEQEKQKAQLASRAKSEFLANMSHEIRTPLNSIIGTSELLANTRLSTEQHKYVEVLTMAGNMLLALINNILDFSKIESGSVEIAKQPLSVRDILGEVAQVITESAKENQIQLNIFCQQEVPAAVSGDPTRLKQVLLNLASNAIKFCPSGHVTIRADLLGSDDEKAWLHFSVEDTGKGIPPDKLEVIFEKFTQLDEFTTKKYAGTGLGLAICKRLVEMMGGTIGVTSEVGHGSLFWFDLPFARCEDGEVVVSASTAMEDQLIPLTKEGKKITPRFQGQILLVEDYPPNRQMAKTMLEKMGCTVDVAQNGEEALERLASSSYDAVFMDCQMPEMDGFQTTAEIRKREKDKHTIIIAMTAHVLSGDRERCLNAGMDAYVSKPIRSVELGRVLKKYLAA